MFPHYLPRGEAKQLPAAVADSPCMNESCIDLPYVSLFKGPMLFPHFFAVFSGGGWRGGISSTSGGFCSATETTKVELKFVTWVCNCHARIE